MGGINAGVIGAAIKRFGSELDEEAQNAVWERLVSYLAELSRKPES